MRAFWLFLFVIGGSAGWFPSVSSAQAASSVSGVVIDSVHGGPLRDAVVRLEPLGREAITASDGSFAFAQVPLGKYRIRVVHFMLDTLGLAVETPEFSVESAPATVPVSVPKAERVISALCQPAQLLRGPRAIVGFVRDPDTEAPIVGARVTFMYQSIPVARTLNIPADPSLRETRTDASGRFAICGIPLGAPGRLQAEHAGIATGEVEVSPDEELILRGLRMAPPSAIQVKTRPDGTALRVLKGSATVTGRVRERDNSPAEGARVTIIGTDAVAVTDRRGEFRLDSLPAGTHTLEVRKLGFAAVQQAVELSASVPARAEVSLVDAARILAPVTTISQRQTDLEKVGFARRQRSGGGYFYEGDRLNKNGTSFSETLGEVPSLKVIRVGDLSYRYVVTDRRDPSGCVNFVVDGNRWRSGRPGDIDDFVTPKEVEAIEVYNASTVPAEFAFPESGRCATIVVWTNATIRPQRR
jgi:hypothetical protein